MKAALDSSFAELCALYCLSRYSRRTLASSSKKKCSYTNSFLLVKIQQIVPIIFLAAHQLVSGLAELVTGLG